MHLLGIEASYSYFLDFYILIDFEIPNDFYLILSITYPNYYLRDLQGTVEIEFYHYYDYYGIAMFEAFLPFPIENISDIKIDFNNIKDNKNNQIHYVLNTEYILLYEDELFFENITDIEVYKVIDITKGKNFSLILNEDISTKKNLIIQFYDSLNKNNIIEANCVLSYENYNIIPCSVKEKEDSTKNYIMKNYFHLDREKGQIISINIYKPSKNYLIIESENETSDNTVNKESKKLSIEIIIIIILGILLLISIVVIIIIIIKLKKMKIKYDKKDIYKSENRKSMEINKILPTFNGISSAN